MRTDNKQERISLFGESQSKQPGLILRLGALALDLSGGFLFLLIMALNFGDPGISLAVFVALFVIGDLSGWTPGNAVAGIRVIGPDRGAPGVVYGFIRFVASLLTLATGGLGFLTIPFTPRKQALHDLLSKTQVVQLNPEDSLARALGAWFLAGTLGYLAMAIIVPNVTGANVRAPVAVANAELRNLAVGLESYYIDNRSYPLPDKEGWVAITIIGPATGYTPRTLTTPVAHQSSLPDDPFRKGKHNANVIESFAYHYATNPKTCWIMASDGPDRDLDTDLFRYVDPEQCDCDPKKFYAQLGGFAILYDPSNGTISNGDIFRTGP